MLKKKDVLNFRVTTLNSYEIFILIYDLVADMEICMPSDFQHKCELTFPEEDLLIIHKSKFIGL